MTHTRLITCMVWMAIICITACATTPDPTNRKQARAARNLGEAHLLAGNYTAALRELLKSEHLYADDHILQDLLGVVYLNKGDHRLAIRHLKRAIKLKPGYAPAHNNLGTVYMAQKKWDAAIEEFEQVTQDMLYATPHFPLFNLGKVYYIKKDFPKAERYYKQALKHEPAFIKAQLGLAQTYRERLRLQEAFEVLQSAMQQHPKAAPLYFELGQVYQLGELNDRARQAYARVVELDPDGPLARKAKAKMAQLP